MKLSFKQRAIIHFIVTSGITVYLGMHVDSLFVFFMGAVPLWYASYLFTKVTLEPYEAEK